MSIVQSKITQICVEGVNKSSNNIRVTQLNAEIIRLPPNNIRVSQLCVEVVIKLKSQTYTDSVANCNFAF